MRGHVATARLLAKITGQTRCYSAPAERAIPPSKQKYVPTSGSYPKGFLAGSAFAGVKASNTKYDDVALVVSEEPCLAAGIFTRNIFKAAPVQASKSILSRSHGENIKGVVINSGCANAVTGKIGLEHANAMARKADSCFNDQKSSGSSDTLSTLVMSTGVIGQRLPIDRITNAIPKAYESLGADHENWLRTAQAICTTDTFPKLISRTFTLPSHPDTTYSIAGMTKGAGMIHPNMGTLLAIVCTDAKIAADGSLDTYLRNAASTSFNSLSIDGDTSTNDTVNFFANGAAAPESASPLSAKSPASSDDHAAFQKVLEDFFVDLSELVVRDGEGATKFIKIRVITDQGALAARRAAASIATSALFKTAMYGKDANWGRILCAIGYAPGIADTLEVPVNDLSTSSTGIDLQDLSVSFVPTDGSSELQLLIRGEPQDVNEQRAKEILELEDLEIVVRMVKSDAATSSDLAEVVYRTCDFSHEYVTINGDYRT